jgi:hypothetical protein
MDFARLIDSEIVRMQRDLADNIEASGQRATGKTIAQLRSEAFPEMGLLYGPAHIGALETGVRPAADPKAKPGRAFVASIRAWLDAKGLGANPWAVATSILRKGTRLHRGEDPRFGKPTGTLTDVLRAGVARFRLALLGEAGQRVKTEVFTAFTSR